MRRLLLLLFTCVLFISCSNTKNVIENTNIEMDLSNKTKENAGSFEVVRELESNYEDIIVNEISYISDGFNISGFEIKPKDIKSLKYPLIVYNRGGNNGFGEMSDDFVTRYLTKFAEAGYVVMTSQLRGSHSEGKDEFGGDDLNDINCLIDLSYTLDYIDLDRIYIIGASRGSMMTLMTLRERSDIKAAAVIGTMSDLINTYNNRSDLMKDVLDEAIGGPPEEKMVEYQQRSAIYWSDEILVPLLMMHGGDDWRCLPAQAITLKEKLDQYKLESKLIIYEDDDHYLSNNLQSSFSEIITWFELH